MKLSLVCLLVLVVCTPGLGSAVPGVKTSEPFQQHNILDKDGNYILFWNFNDTHVTFETHVRTRGWVGFGLSPNGDMFPGDVVVGWVSDDGTAHFADRHTTGHRPPIRDASQDWFLLFAEENSFGTVLKFVRKLATCDTKEDIAIPQGTVRAIFAYGAQDPTSDDGITYHGTTRGTKSLSLLSKMQVPATTPSDVIEYDFLNTNYLMPNDTTTYFCKAFRMQDIGKHHMIKFEPVITPGNELNVHHILLYRCPGVVPASKDGIAGTCDDVRHQHLLPSCQTVITAWAIGGQGFYFPENVGFPISDVGHSTYYIMETHYDNPTQRTGVIDNSGLRFTLTKTLRTHDAGLFELGHKVTPFQVVPPFQEAFVTKTYCGEKCLAAGFTSSNLTEVKMFAATQHAHLLATSISTRHFRNGAELKPLIEDPDYDFNFQEARTFPQEVPVYPGDSFRVDCTYDSRGRSRATFGGLSTQEEMCLTFAYYYPKMGMATCLSTPIFNNYNVKGAQLYQKMAHLDWSDPTLVNDFKNKLAASTIDQKCAGEHHIPMPQHSYYVPSEPAHPYVAPPPTC